MNKGEQLTNDIAHASTESLESENKTDTLVDIK